ncbi:CatB-related O-acetyltransferase [Pseudomonas monteilii]|uniref:CatB-related O-acetyltransferase n=1 Tax=Pseudomonas monteilii TaxID=76759 RepID=UPI001E4C616B|nr:CatB-related O-acetyltransferase [Pseudomonas monteilii]MCE0931623.1 CatB-related O-acetyltransferase [Pseudomonas monteilii]MCE1009179.1 CatB-related O-acetyltransferase [Pseudomonas monteilii]WJN90219.1 CatB-related O-acetyltransferase [Pseudomonas monteilii]WJO34831.1 CatB-related O-acetyltransferase [Pseudomonas monteilii]WJR41176.1 CatB-related O-acetyltransferase [Pseudomonas monteilii]
MKIPAYNAVKALAEKKVGVWRKQYTANPTGQLPSDLLLPNKLRIEPYCRLAVCDSLYNVGSFTYCMSSMPASVSIGRYCSIATGVRVLGPRHPYERISTSPFTYDRKFFEIHSDLDEVGDFSPTPYKGTGKYGIKIGNDVWIGEGVTIAGSLTIGDGAVIAGNSHVVKDVPPYSIVGGNPAKVLRMRFDSDDLIAELQELQWWKYKFFDFGGFNTEDPVEFAKQLRNKISSESVAEYNPELITNELFV